MNEMKPPPGHTLFAQYAYPPNELGYCGPTNGGVRPGVSTPQLAKHAEEFDGVWPYLTAIADAIGGRDALDEEVVRSYWVGGPALRDVDPSQLLARLRAAFKGQVTGMLDQVPATAEVMAHHSFHVFVVYPWVRFLDRDAMTALQVMQDCRIRWGTVEAVDGEQVVITSRPLRLDQEQLSLGEPHTEHVRWKKGELTLASMPAPGDIVSAHWDWICGTLSDDERAALATATQATLDLVNTARAENLSVLTGERK